MSHEVPFVWYDPINGERIVVGQCVVEGDGTFTVVIDDELIADAITSQIYAPMSIGFMVEKLPAVRQSQEEPEEFKIKFDPGKFGVRSELNEFDLEPDTSIWDEVNNHLFPHRNKKQPLFPNRYKNKKKEERS